jgi:hypothetical protein
MNLRALSVRSLLAFGLIALPVLHAGQAAKAPAPKPGDHCWRPIPKPILTAPQAGLVSDTFKKTAAREAMETTVLDGGATLTITHWGCRALMLTFRLEAKGLPDFSKNVPAGYLEATRQLRHLATLKARTGFNLEKAAAALEADVKRTKGLAYIRPVSIPGSGQDKVTVQGAGAVQGKGVNYLAFEFMRPLQKKKPAVHASK